MKRSIRVGAVIFILAHWGTGNALTASPTPSKAPLTGSEKTNSADFIENQFAKEDNKWESFTNNFGHYRIEKPKCWRIDGDEGNDPKTSWMVLVSPTSDCKTQPNPLIELSITTPNTEIGNLDNLLRYATSPIVGGYLNAFSSRVSDSKAVTMLQIKDYEGKKAIGWEIRSTCHKRNLLITYFYLAEVRTLENLQKEKNTVLPTAFQKTLDSFRCL